MKRNSNAQPRAERGERLGEEEKQADGQDVKRSRWQEEVTKEWLLETFKDVLHAKNVTNLLAKLHAIDPYMIVGGLMAIGLAEVKFAKDGLPSPMEKRDIPEGVRVAIQLWAEAEKTAKDAVTAPPSLLPLPIDSNEKLNIAELDRHELNFEDERDVEKSFAVKIADDLEAYVSPESTHHQTGATGPIVTGPPGSGKSRFAEEGARRFVNRKPESRILARVSLDSSGRALPRLQTFVPKEERSSSDMLVAATLLFAVFELDPTEYRFTFDDVALFCAKHLPSGITTVALILDEFSNDLTISERLFSGCLAVNAKPSRHMPNLRIALVIAGVHRVQVPRQLDNLLGMRQRASGQGYAIPRILDSLSEKVQKALIVQIAEKLNVSYDAIMNPKAMGLVLEGCGGSPALLVLVYVTLSGEGFGSLLSQIKTQGVVGAESGKVFWTTLSQKLALRFSVDKFADMVSPAPTVPERAAASQAYLDVTKKRASEQVATVVMERLLYLTMAGMPVQLAAPVLRKEEIDALKQSDSKTEVLREVHTFTYLKAMNLVPIKRIGDSITPTLGVISMPPLVVASLSERLISMRNERDLTNPFVMTPYLLEKAAMESIANVFRAAAHLGRESVLITEIRPSSHFWGPKTWNVRVPSSVDHVATLADHLHVRAHHDRRRTESNAKGSEIELREGTILEMAVNERAIDGSAIFKEKLCETPIIWVSQMKSTTSHVPQTGEDGRPITVQRADVLTLLTGMRERAKELAKQVGVTSTQNVIYVYDLVTMWTLSPQFPHEGDSTPFELNENETLIITTKKTIGTALGPILGKRVSFVYEN